MPSHPLRHPARLVSAAAALGLVLAAPGHATLLRRLSLETVTRQAARVLHATVVDHIQVIRRGKVRRAKLYYLRNLRGKAARIKELDTRAKGKKAAE